MSSYLRPRRGKKSTAEAQLTSSNPLKRGEVFFEVPDEGVGTGAGKIKMGDGSTAYTDLPYFLESGSGGGGIGEDITITLSSSNWTAETISGETYYTQVGAAAGATSSTVPVIVPIYTTDAEMEAYSNIFRVEPMNNALKFIALDIPSVNLTVVAKFAVESTADLEAVSKAIGVEITQAEYDLLTPEEKANGTYWITDGSAPGTVVDSVLDTTSHNAIQNAPVATAINSINTDITRINADLSDKATKLYLNGNILYLRNADNENLSSVTLPEDNTPVKYKYEQRATKTYNMYYTGYNSGGTAVVPTATTGYNISNTAVGLVTFITDGYSGGDAGAIANRRIQVSTSSTFSSYTTVNAGSEAFVFGYYKSAATYYCRIPPT